MFAGAYGGKEVGHRDALAELTCALMVPPGRGCNGGGTPSPEQKLRLLIFDH